MYMDVAGFTVCMNVFPVNVFLCLCMCKRVRVRQHLSACAINRRRRDVRLPWRINERI